MNENFMKSILKRLLRAFVLTIALLTLVVTVGLIVSCLPLFFKFIICIILIAVIVVFFYKTSKDDMLDN